MSKATPEIPEKPSLEKLILEMGMGADADIYALSNLVHIAKLAAFASEARRTLSGIDKAMQYHPKAEETIRAMVPAWRQWSAMDDTVAPVLDHLAGSMDKLVGVIEQRTIDAQARFRLVNRTG